MEMSGLFQENFIHQIKVVAHLFDWTNLNHDVGIANKNIGGQFVFYENKKLFFHKIIPTPRSAIFIDGSKVIHGETINRPEEKVPFGSEDEVCSIAYNSNINKWQIICDDNIIKEYSFDNVRLSIIYQARCFKDQNEMKKFKSNSPQHKMKLNDILNIFINNMIHQNISTKDSIESMSKLDLALLIMKTYTKYPFPSTEVSYFSFNYCLIPRIFKWSLPFF
eukprot:gene9036-12182_t